VGSYTWQWKYPAHCKYFYPFLYLLSHIPTFPNFCVNIFSLPSRDAKLLIIHINLHTACIATYDTHTMNRHSLVPRPSHPRVCRLQHYCWGRPGKTESRALTYLDMWRSGKFPVKSTSGYSTDHKHEFFLGSESQFTAVQKECATPPHVQVHHRV